MNEIASKFLLPGDKFMPEMHLRQPGFMYTACETFTKNKEQIKKFKETGDSTYIYQNELDKGCFQDDMAHGRFLINFYLIKHLLLLKIQNMMDIKEILLQWLINVLIKSFWEMH